jgi:hypothetical protein
VSEDFDQALRLQIAGFIIRLASYHNGGFEEGVSLTVFDELARWEKYTYGCNELLFHPLWKWPFKGPLTPLLWKLITSNVKSTSKVTILGYVFTYYAMAAALPFTVLNYFLTGWVQINLDQYYLTSFKMMLSLLVVFNLVVRFLAVPAHPITITNNVLVTNCIQLPPPPPWQDQLLQRNAGDH